MSSLHDQVNYWATVAGRPCNKFEQLVVARPFKLASYGHNWNRVLKPVWGGTPNGIVELSVTPINGFDFTRTPQAKAMFFEMRIRNHVTQSDPRDKYSSQIPDDLRAKLIECVGAEQAQYMLYGNIWENIDWEKYAKARVSSMGGGIPLRLCMRSPLEFKIDGRNN